MNNSFFDCPMFHQTVLLEQNYGQRNKERGKTRRGKRLGINIRYEIPGKSERCQDLCHSDESRPESC